MNQYTRIKFSPTFGTVNVWKGKNKYAEGMPTDVDTIIRLTGIPILKVLEAFKNPDKVIYV